MPSYCGEHGTSCHNHVVSVGTGDCRQDALGGWSSSPSTVGRGRGGLGCGEKAPGLNLKVQK